MKKKEELKIVFMGTPEFAVAGLNKLWEEKYNIVAVVTAPDKPSGRGQKLHESAVKKYAVEKNIPALQPVNLKDENFVSTLKELNADLFIVVAFRMLPKAVWEIPPMGTFNLHGSILPEYRGAAPINWAIINGEKETGVTTFFIDEKIDTGQILFSQKMKIGDNETAGELHDRMMVVGADAVIHTVELIRKAEAQPFPQPDKISKNAPKITKQDTLINFNLSATEMHNFIRGMSPYPTAWMKITNGKQERIFKIFQSEIIDNKKRKELALLKKNDLLILELYNGTIALLEVQLEGKKRLNYKDFLLGFNTEEWKILKQELK